MKSAVVTGPTGVIGTALVNELLKNGVKVTAVIRPDSEKKDRLSPDSNLDIVYCDMDSFDKLPDLISGPQDVFFHLAWEGTTGEKRSSMDLQQRNIKNSIKACEASYKLKCKTFVGVGSQAEYGRCNRKLTGNTIENPQTPYGKAKLLCSQMTREFCQNNGIRHIWARVLSVYGPNDWNGSLIISTIKDLLCGNNPEVTKGEQIWDYMYSEDASRALISLSENGISGKTYVVGSGTGRPLREYIEIIGQNTNPEFKIEFGKKPYSSNQVMYLVADIGELEKDTGFKVQVPFEEGIKYTIKWVREALSEKGKHSDSML